MLTEANIQFDSEFLVAVDENRKKEIRRKLYVLVDEMIEQLALRSLEKVVIKSQILFTFMLFKDSACNGSVNSRRSFYSPAYCFGLSAIIVYIQLKFGFSFPVLLYCASMTLFGVFLIQYNKEMQRHK